jgi:hypothetical protein
MDIEPLKSLLEGESDVKDTLMYYLKRDVREKVIKLNYEDKNLYINDRIYCIKRNTLELEHIGNIISIDNNIISLKITTVKSININKDNYYMFVKIKKNDVKKRDFMKNLLEVL